MAADGISDISFGIPGYTSSQFPALNLTELPGFAGNQSEANATEQLWKKMKYFEKEFPGVKVLVLLSGDLSVIVTKNKAIRTPADLKGLRIRVPTREQGEMVEFFGGVVSNMPLTEVYNALDRFLKGWSGSHSRRLRGYRLYLAVDTDTGQVITFLLARGRMRDARLLPVLARRLRRLLGRRLAGVVADSGVTSKAAVAALREAKVPFILGFRRTKPVRVVLAGLSGHQRRWLRAGGATDLGACHWGDGTRLIALAARTPTDRRGPWVYITSLWGAGPQRLARTYRRRWRVEQVLDELVNGHDLDHLVGYRLAPNRVAVGLRLLARNLAIGLQIRDAGQRPAVIREPLACRAAQVEGLGAFVVAGELLIVRALRPPPADEQPLALPWTGRRLRYAA